VSDIIAEIAAASQEQSTGIDQVNKAIAQMDEVTQQNAALVEEAAAASESMNDQARGLGDMMQFFNVGDGGSSPQPSRSSGVSSQSQSSSAPRAPQNAANKAPSVSSGGSDGDWDEF